MAKINPVKATCQKFKGRENSIQGMNDTCFGICAAFSGTFDTYAMDPQCTKACEDFIEKKKYDIYGVGSCDHQAPSRPVFWGETPRYVPQLLKRGLPVEQARETCKNICVKKGGTLVEECIEKCDLDANAVEPYEKPVQKANFSEPEKNSSSSHKLVWIILGIVLITILVLILLKR